MIDLRTRINFQWTVSLGTYEIASHAMCRDAQGPRGWQQFFGVPAIIAQEQSPTKTLSIDKLPNIFMELEKYPNNEQGALQFTQLFGFVRVVQAAFIDGKPVDCGPDVERWDHRVADEFLTRVSKAEWRSALLVDDWKQLRKVIAEVKGTNFVVQTPHSPFSSRAHIEFGRSDADGLPCLTLQPADLGSAAIWQACLAAFDPDKNQRFCAACRTPFKPRRRDAKFCSKRCANSANYRKRRTSNPIESDA